MKVLVTCKIRIARLTSFNLARTLRQRCVQARKTIRNEADKLDKMIIIIMPRVGRDP